MKTKILHYFENTKRNYIKISMRYPDFFHNEFKLIVYKAHTLECHIHTHQELRGIP